MSVSREQLPAAVRSLSPEGGPRRLLALHFGGAYRRGSEIVLAEVLRRLPPERWSIDLIAENGVLPDYLGPRPNVQVELRHHPHVMVDGREREFEPVQLLRQVRYLARTIRERNIDVVYCNSARPTQAAFIAARLTGRPIVCHLHIGYNRRYFYFYGVRWCDRLIATCEVMRQQALSKLGDSPPPVDIVYNGVDTARYTAQRRDEAIRRELGISADEFIVGHIGTYTFQKGVDLLLPAFARIAKTHSRARLLLVGPGDSSPYARQAAELGIAERVLFRGPTDRPEQYLQHVFDINVLSSRFEALPLTLMEACAAGCPSVATTVGGVPEVLENDTSALLVPPLDVDALSRAIDALLGSADLRARLATAARERVRRLYDFSNTAAGVEQSLLRAISEKVPESV